MPEDKKFGEFLDGVLRPREVESRDDEETWADGLQKAAERYLLPGRVKELEKELKKRKSGKGRCDLWKLVAEAKKSRSVPASDHGAICRRVDLYLGKQGWELADKCPKSWKKDAPDMPRLLDEARKHPKLKGRIKTLISQAH